MVSLCLNYGQNYVIISQSLNKKSSKPVLEAIQIQSIFCKSAKERPDTNPQISEHVE